MERRALDSCGKEMGTASVRLLEAIILLCPKLFIVDENQEISSQYHL
ncbi:MULTISPECIES: hypothetical protein [Priestia]|nr:MULTISPECIES: hypothetical protein [Priestia]SCC36095.1 hypothetical protein GA0061087_103225 [Priestia flexa]